MLHHRAYRETSLLLDIFSLHHGRVNVIAKGVRKNKRNQSGLFQLYQPLLLSWFGYGELKTLSASESASASYQLTADSSLCGLYVNELMVRLLPINEPESDVFSAYEQVLARLQQGDNNELALRLFEKKLLTHLGYGLTLNSDVSGQAIELDQHYYYQLDTGLIRWQQGINQTTISGRSLQHLLQESDFDHQSLQEIKQLMRTVINYHLGGKPLQSRALFVQLHRYAGKY